MTPSKWPVRLIVGGVLLVAGGLLFVLFVEKRPMVSTASGPVAASPAVSPAKPASQAALQFRTQPPIQRVQSFYESESARVGAVDPDPKATEARLSEIAQELAPDEIDWLKARVLNEKEPADARFFAVYLVALSRQPGAVAALREIALSPIPDQKKNQAAAETKRMIAAQGTEGLSRHCGSRDAQDALLDVQERQTDEFVRDRAHRGLYALAQCQAVESGDKKAIGELLYGEPGKK